MATQTVLVVDDDCDIVEIVGLALEGEGYHVLSAVGGAALAIAHDHLPDVILLDLMMPGMDGVEVSKRLRADPVTAGIPIILMSAHENIGTIGTSMRADDRLTKPFHLDNLYETVGRWAEAC